MNKGTNFSTENTKRQLLRILAFVLFFASFVLLVFWAYSQQKTYTLYNTFTYYPTDTSQSTLASGLVASSSRPITLVIPKANIHTTFEGSLGLDESNAIVVPQGYDTVGWYKNGPLPGETGPSVILGHVDSKDGPAVFFSLGEVSIHDEVYIERIDGSKLTFTIEDIERVEQDEFPSERVYGAVPYAGLRLITCSGIYDKGVERYSHNLIVYAVLTNIEYSDSVQEAVENSL